MTSKLGINWVISKYVATVEQFPVHGFLSVSYLQKARLLLMPALVFSARLSRKQDAHHSVKAIY